MKQQTIYQTIVVALALFFISISGSAQSVDTLMTVQVPFDFQVNGNQLPAGKYTFKRIPSMPNVLIIQGSGLTATVMYAASSAPSEMDMDFTLSFNEYGDQRFLSEVKVTRRGYEYSLTKSKAERELRQTQTAHIIRLVPIEKP